MRARERRDRERRERAIETSPVIIIMIIIYALCVGLDRGGIYYVVANKRDDVRTRFFPARGCFFIHRYQNVPT